MKRKRTSPSAFFNLRALLGLVLVVSGLAIALTALRGLTDGPNQSQSSGSPGLFARIASAIGLHSETLVAQNVPRLGGGSAALSKNPPERGQAPQAPASSQW